MLRAQINVACREISANMHMNYYLIALLLLGGGIGVGILGGATGTGAVRRFTGWYRLHSIVIWKNTESYIENNLLIEP